LIRNKDVYQRNRKAVLLLKKSKKEELTLDEEDQFQRFRKAEVLLRNSQGQLRLSDRAIRELFTW